MKVIETYVMSITQCKPRRDQGSQPCIAALHNWWNHKEIYRTSSCTYWQSFCLFLFKLCFHWMLGYMLPSPVLRQFGLQGYNSLKYAIFLDSQEMYHICKNIGHTLLSVLIFNKTYDSNILEKLVCSQYSSWSWTRQKCWTYLPGIKFCNTKC